MRYAVHFARLGVTFIALGCVTWAADATTYAIGGTQIAVTVTPEKPSILLGEKIWLIYRMENRGSVPFTFKHVSSGDYLGNFWSPNSLIQVFGTDGQIVGTPFPPPVAFGSGPPPGPITIAPGSSTEFRYYLPVWAVFELPGTYRIRARRAVGGPVEYPVFDASTEIRVEPADPVRMGAIIASLGDAVIRERDRGGFDDLATALYQIEDERVTPYLRRLIYENGPGENGPVNAAFAALSKFNSDEALEIIRHGLDYTVADLPARMQNLPRSQDPAGRVRDSAVFALMTSRHPKAFGILTGFQKDPSDSIRNHLVHAAARQEPAIGLPVLEAMADDPVSFIGPEARRYIALIKQPGYQSPAVVAAAPPIVRRGNALVVRFDARPADLARFKDAKGITSLTFTREGSGRLSYLTARDLENIEEWTELKTLDLGPIPMTDEVLLHLVRLTKLEKAPSSPLFAPTAQWITSAAAAAIIKRRGW